MRNASRTRRTRAAEVRKSGEVIVRQNERIRDLVEDLNIVSKLEYDSQPMNIETIQVVPFARGIVADYLNTGIDVQYDLEFLRYPHRARMRHTGR